MEVEILREIIRLYKQQFKYIHDAEIYKWRAVKCFKDNWNIESKDFLQMLNHSFALSKNLLDSGLYYPKRMLLKNTEVNPAYIRQLFRNLYDEDVDIITRIQSFQRNIKAHSRKVFPTLKNDYQDLRAIIVYLCLQYPDRYFLYKFGMFKQFVQLVDYSFKPSRGEIENFLQYTYVCDILKGEILKDNELLKLHKTRLTEHEFFDSSFNILTQDIIYAAVHHINKLEKPHVKESALKRLIIVNRNISASLEKFTFKGSFINYIENERENKRVGDLGELLVLQHEEEKLKSLGINRQPKHISKLQGDGLGYDILSYDENEQEIFIEVKTTVHGFNAPFFVTRNELERSKQDNSKFFLYRLYDFNEINNKAKYFQRQGDLTEICVNPTLYKAIINEL